MNESTTAVPHHDDISTASGKIFRSVLFARLTNTSPLAIHNGLGTEDLKAFGQMEHERKFREPGKWHDGVQDCDALIMRDAQDQPCIPGSSLKGVIREWLTRSSVDAQDNSVIDWMLGKPSSSSDDGDGGAVVFRDANLIETEDPTATALQHWPFYDHKSRTFVEQHTAINRRTGAVQNTALYNVEAIPPGFSFQICLIVDDASRQFKGEEATETHQRAVELLQQALLAFNLEVHHSPPQLGSDTRKGWGRMHCSHGRTQRWSPDDQSFPHPDPQQPDGEWSLRNDSAAPNVRHRRLHLTLLLQFESPFLSCDPARSLLAAKAPDEKDAFDPQREESQCGTLTLPKVDQVPRLASPCRIEKDTSKQEYSVLGKPLLSASSFKGAFRSCIERILRTLNHDLHVSPHGQLQPMSKSSPNFAKLLLGMESQQSGLWCSDFSGHKEAPLCWREMVAVDRFTGGAADGAKFNVLAFQKPLLRGEIAVDLSDDDQEAKAMLGAVFLALRDLVDGLIPFGYGDMKGFGQCQATICKVNLSGFSSAEQTPFSPGFQQQLRAAFHGKLQLDQLDDAAKSALQDIHRQLIDTVGKPAPPKRSDSLNHKGGRNVRIL